MLSLMNVFVLFPMNVFVLFPMNVFVLFSMNVFVLFPMNVFVLFPMNVCVMDGCVQACTKRWKVPPGTRSHWLKGLPRSAHATEKESSIALTRPKKPDALFVVTFNSSEEGSRWFPDGCIWFNIISFNYQTFSRTCINRYYIL